VLGLAALGISAAAARAADATDIAAANAEGKVSWYTSTPIETANRIAKLFEEKTGIKVQMFRSGGTAILRRFMQEYDAKHIAADKVAEADRPKTWSDLTNAKYKGMLVTTDPSFISLRWLVCWRKSSAGTSMRNSARTTR
jgi:ABC-type Fe3+ transport system substrate-binding protein